MKNNHSKKKSSQITNVFIQCEGPLKRFIARFFHKLEDIDDIAQETFLRAYQSRTTDEIERPKSYLFKIAKNVALRELSRKNAQITEFLDLVVYSEVEGGDLLEEKIEAEQKIKLYITAIADLPPQCRRVFLMRKYQGLTHKQISKKLSISTSAVEKHIAYGIKRCQKLIEEKENSYGPEVMPIRGIKDIE